MQWALVERELLMEPLVIVRAWDRVVEELGHWLVHRDQVLAMELRPDLDQLLVQIFQHDRALVLQELDVEQRLVVMDLPVRV